VLLVPGYGEFLEAGAERRLLADMWRLMVIFCQVVECSHAIDVKALSILKKHHNVVKITRNAF
jgi:hypothetical protein